MLQLKNKALADYFDLDPETDAIWMKGHRVGIDLILDSYLAGKSMTDLQEEFPSLTAEELHAAITFYLLNRSELDRWLAQAHAEAEQHMREVDAHPAPVTERLRRLREGKRG